MNNPFTLNFGLEPTAYISRHFQTDEIIENFTSEPSPSHVYMITGVRGSGKTVLLTEIEEKNGADVSTRILCIQKPSDPAGHYRACRIW